MMNACFGDNEMFRQILVDLVRMLNLFAWTAGLVLAQSKAVSVNVKASLDRPWVSNSSERDFERQMAARRAFNELQSKLPIAR